MPAPPRWLLAVPDAVRQLERLDRDLVTRRDLEKLFGVSRARAAQLMREFGAELAGSSRVPARGGASCGSSRSSGGGAAFLAARRSPPAPWICLSRQPSTNMEQMGSAEIFPTG